MDRRPRDRTAAQVFTRPIPPDSNILYLVEANMPIKCKFAGRDYAPTSRGTASLKIVNNTTQFHLRLSEYRRASLRGNKIDREIVRSIDRSV